MKCLLCVEVLFQLIVQLKMFVVVCVLFWFVDEECIGDWVEWCGFGCVGKWQERVCVVVFVFLVLSENCECGCGSWFLGKRRCEVFVFFVCMVDLSVGVFDEIDDVIKQVFIVGEWVSKIECCQFVFVVFVLELNFVGSCCLWEFGDKVYDIVGIVLVVYY